MLMTVEQVLGAEFVGIKFLRFSDESWAFWEVDIGSPSHKEVASGRSVKGAGMLAVRGKGEFVMEDSYSSSLRIGCDEETWGLLEKVLGVKVKSRLEAYFG